LRNDQYQVPVPGNWMKIESLDNGLIIHPPKIIHFDGILLQPAFDLGVLCHLEMKGLSVAPRYGCRSWLQAIRQDEVSA